MRLLQSFVEVWESVRVGTRKGVFVPDFYPLQVERLRVTQLGAVPSPPACQL